MLRFLHISDSYKFIDDTSEITFLDTVNEIAFLGYNNVTSDAMSEEFIADLEVITVVSFIRTVNKKK